MVTSLDLPLVILAAGHSSRFGGNKQQTAIGVADEYLLEFNLFEAVRAGVRRVYLIIRPGSDSDWNPLLERWGALLDIQLRYQPEELLPGIYPQTRSRPWGTGHALLAVLDEIPGDFLLINADDYYGPEAIASLAKLPDAGMALAAFHLKDTLSEEGSVNRGRCLSRGDILAAVEEYRNIYREESEIRGTNLMGEEQMLEPDTLVSMNCWRLDNRIRGQLLQAIEDVVREGYESAGEIFLPSLIQFGIIEEEWLIRIIEVSGPWYGLTFTGDLPCVREKMLDLQQTLYQVPLWKNN